MLIDLMTAGASVRLGDYDTVVAGSGPAGLSLALRLVKNGQKVAVLEAGGLQYSQQSQDNYLAGDMGYEWAPFVFNRLRFLGGTSNHWAGRCRPFDRFDFEPKSEYYEQTNWPISFDEVDQYLGDAKEILDLGRDTPFVARPGTEALESFYADKFLKSPPTRFNSKYLDQIESSENLDVYINANVTDIRLGAGSTAVSHLVVNNYQKESFKFTAANFALAMGALETPRLLLNCNSQHSGGLGNGGDMVGRCFMEHINVHSMLEFYPSTSKWEGIDKMAFYTDHEFAREQQIGCSNVALTKAADLVVHGRAKGIKRAMARRACDWGQEKTLARVFDFKCPGQGIAGTLMEQFPDRENRVYLSSQVDDFGLRRLDLNWHLSARDKHSIRTIAQRFAVQATDAGLGRFKLPDYVFDTAAKIPVAPHAHHMGTTRMAESETDGVVDRDCKVFGTDNLFVAGASVFPRGGSNNPTMPGVQLALRLADHLVANR